MAAVDPFGLPPEEAIRWFRQKGYKLTFNWQEQWGAAHARAFTVAKATQLDVLADIREAVDRAIAKGTSLGAFRTELRPTLQRKGWWGEKEVVNPNTGETELVQLGSANRLRTIYETNLRQAQAAGRWERMQRTKAARPYGRYVAIDDGNTRKEHLAWHGTILPLDHPWWKTHAPPNGWGCRCRVQQLSDRDLARYGFKVSEKAPPVKMVTYTNPHTGVSIKVPKGISPGFGYNAGDVPRGWTPPDNAPVLQPVRSWRDYGRPPSREAQHAQPEGPAIWDREHNEAARAETERLFRELFGIADGEESATIKDAQGEEVSVSMRFLDHMRGAHKRDGAIDERRTQFTPLAKATIQAPFEVWMVPHRRADGSVVMRKRYIGLFSGRQDLVVVERGDDGYAAWTAMPSRNLDAQRQGYLLYPR